MKFVNPEKTEYSGLKNIVDKENNTKATAYLVVRSNWTKLDNWEWGFFSIIFIKISNESPNSAKPSVLMTLTSKNSSKYINR